MRESHKLSTQQNKISTGSKGLSTISKNMGSIGTNAGNMANQLETALKSIADMNGDFTAAADGLSIMSKAVGELVRVGQGLTGVATKIKNIGTALKGISDAGNIFNAPLVNIETQVNGATNAVVNGTTKMKSSFTSTRDSATSFSNNVTQGFVRLQQALNFTPKFEVMKAGMMSFSQSLNVVQAGAEGVKVKLVGLSSAVEKTSSSIIRFSGANSSATATINTQMAELSGLENIYMQMSGVANTLVSATGRVTVAGTQAKASFLSQSQGLSYLRNAQSQVMSTSASLTGEFRVLTASSQTTYSAIMRQANAFTSFNTASRSAMSAATSLSGEFRVLTASSQTTYSAMMRLANASTSFSSATMGAKTAAVGLSGQFQTVGTAMDGMSAKAKTATTRINELDQAGKLLRRTFSMFVVMYLFNFAMGLSEAAGAAINARENIKSMAELMGWSGQQTDAFTAKIRELQGTYAKIDMTQVGSQVAGIAQQYNLSAEAATNFIDVAGVFTAAMATEGRSTEDATLALKDYMDQGTGWQRRMQEIGVTEDKLKATGLWNGDKNDVNGLIAALGELEKQMHLVQKAQRINTPQEGLNAIKATIGNIAADLYEIFGSDITGLLRGINAALWQLDYFINAVRDGFNSLPKPLQGIIHWLALTGVGTTAVILVLGKIIPVLKNAAAGVKLFFDAMRNGGVLNTLIRKLGEYLGLLEKIDDVQGGSTGDGGTTGKKKKKQKTPTDGDNFPDVPNTDKDKGKVKKWEDYKVEIKEMGFKFVKAAAAIVMVMGLIAVAILSLLLPMAALALAGMAYKRVEPQVKQGIEAVKSMAIVIAPLAVAVVALITIMDKFNISATRIGKSALSVGTSIAVVLGLVAEVILMIIPSMISLAAAGYVAQAVGPQIKSGVQAIQTITPILATLTPIVAALVLIMGKFNVSVGTIAKGALSAAAGIAAVLLLVAEAIVLMVVPLYALAVVGDQYSGMEASVDKGIQGIDAVAKALNALLPFALLFIVATIAFIVPEAGLIVACGAMLGIAAAILLLTEAIVLMGVPLIGLAALGDMYAPIEASVNKGIQGINAVTKALNALLPFALLFVAATIAFIAPEAGIIIACGAMLGIAAVILLLTEAIVGMGIPLQALASLGDSLPDMGAVTKGTQAIQQVGIALNVLAEAMKNMTAAVFYTIVNEAMAIVAGFGSINFILGTALDTIKNFITDFNSKNIPLINNGQAKVNAMKQVASVLVFLKSTLAQISSAANGSWFVGMNVALIINALSQVSFLILGINSINIPTVNMGGKITAMKNLIPFLNSLGPVLNAMRGVSVGSLLVGVNTYLIVNAVTQIASLLSQINAVPITAPNLAGKTSAMNGLNTFLTSFKVTVQKVQEAGTAIGPAGIGVATKAIYTGLQAINELVNKVNGSTTVSGGAKLTSAANGIIKLANSVKQGANTIKASASTWRTAGQQIGNQFAAGVNTSRTTVANAMKQLAASGINAIKNRYATFRSAGTAAGKQVATGYKSGIHGIVQATISELTAAINAIKNRYDTFYNAGKAAGEAVSRGYLDGNQIASPGIIARSTKQEMLYTLDYLDESIEPLRERGLTLGQTLSQAYTDSNTLSQDMNLNMNITGGDTSQTAANLSSLMIAQQQYNSQMQQQALMNSTTIQGINSTTATATTGQYTLLGQQMGTTFTQMGNNATTAFNKVGTTSNTAMNKIVTTNKSGLNKANTVTKTELNNMNKTTTSTVGKMNNAWNSMKNHIVSAASQIQTQSYAKFSSLHRSISSFYNQLASAHFSAGLVAGPSNGHGYSTIGRYGANTGGPLNAHGIRTVQKEYIGSSYGPSQSDSKKSKTYLDLLDNPDPELLKMMRVQSGCQGDDCYFGTVDTNYNRIKTTADAWSIADPWFLGIQIPMNNYVRDFEDGKTKRIDASNFEEILRLVLTTRGFANPGTYEYYANSKYSNQEVWDGLHCNCYDGAEMIAEIGQMLGLGGSIVHGSWKGEGHMGAMVAGQLYDMTQFQKHGVFRGTPGVSFGPSQIKTSSVHKEQYGQLADTQDNDSNKNQTVINFDFTGATIYGEEGLIEKIKDAAVKVFYQEQGTNPNTGI